MRQRPLARTLVAALAAFSLGCGSHDAPPVAPTGIATPTLDRGDDDERENRSREGRLLACERRAEVTASGTFGPTGGSLRVGSSRLVIPGGALAAPTTITATIPSDTIAVIRFEPSGLVFEKPARLVLDVRHCARPGSSPEVWYIRDDGTVLERIQAIWNRLRRTIVAPIDHFSAYAVAV